MVHTRIFGGVVAGLVVGLVSASAAPAAVVCGQPAKAGEAATVGQLSLDTKNGTDPALDSFKDKTDPRAVQFVFDVAGCSLAPAADITVKAGGDEGDALSFKTDGVHVKADKVIVDGVVVPKRFTPGTHKPSVDVASPSGLIKTEVFKVSLERKEPALWPTLASVLALLAGFIGAIGAALWAARAAYDKQLAENGPAGAGAAAKHKVAWSMLGLGLALVGAGGAAYAAWKTGYDSSDKWAPDFGTYLALVVAVAGAAAGGATPGLAKAITAKVVPKARQPKPRPPVPEPEPAAG